MAKKPEQGEGGVSAPPIDPEAFYRVRLKKPVPRPNGRVLKPLSEHVMKGSVIAELGDAVASYEKA